MFRADPAVGDKHRMLQITWSYTSHETTLCCRHKARVMSQSTDLFRWPTYPKHWTIYIDAYDTESMTPRRHKSTPVQLRSMLFDIENIRVLVDSLCYFVAQLTGLCIAITAHETPWHLLSWMRTVKQTATRWHSGLFILQYAYISVNNTKKRQRIHNTLLAVDRLLFMGYKYSRRGEASFIPYS